MQTEDLTIIITNWNYGMFLRDATESVLAQTVRPKKIIFADDGSTDESLSIEQEYVANYPDLFEISRVEQRQGLPANLRRTAALVDTKWMCFLAADDKFKPTYVEKALPFFNEPRLAIIYCDMEKFGNWTGVWEVSEWNEDILRNGNYINGHAFILKQAYDDAGGFRENVNGSTDFFEDYYLWIDICDTKKGYYGRRIPEALVMYRRHDFGHRTDRTDFNNRVNRR